MSNSKGEMRELYVEQLFDFIELVDCFSVERTAVAYYEEMLREQPDEFCDEYQQYLDTHRALLEQTAQYILAQSMVIKGSGALSRAFALIRDEV
tara:strand:- start:910 stop:1191 length:282 start_codon:yes stop_codon:yes gene_type:complete